MVAEQANALQVDSNWDRIIEQIKGLSVDQRLKLSENIRQTAIADIKAQQGKLQSELSNLSSLLGTPQTPANGPAQPLPEGATTTDKVLAALRRGGNKTVKMLQAEVGTPWVNTALSGLVQSRQIVSDGKRPAAYSLAR